MTSPALHPARGAGEQNPAAVPPVVTPAAGCPASPTPQAGRVIARSVEPGDTPPVVPGSAAGPEPPVGVVSGEGTAPTGNQEDTTAAVEWLEGQAAKGPVSGTHYTSQWYWQGQS